MIGSTKRNSASEKRNINGENSSLQDKSLKSGSQKQSLIQKIVNARSVGEKFQIYTGEKLHWFQVILLLKRSVIPGILHWVILCGGYGFLISVLDHFEYLPNLTGIKSLPNILISLNVVLSLLLVFRTNTAHERFWEGRKLWGAMVNVVRNQARGIWIYIEEREMPERKSKAAATRLVAAFAVAMKLHLRRDPLHPELAQLMSPLQYRRLQQVNHPPLEIANWIGDYLQRQYEHKRINVFQVADLHAMLNTMVDILGGCERILKTPVPLVYTITLKMLLVIYFMVMPLGIVHELNWWTGLDMAFVSFLLLGLDEIGSEIEEPFGHDPNDLPLDFICKTIVRNVEDLIKESPIDLSREARQIPLR
jgi:ion channel-forming bestrophin family protein